MWVGDTEITEEGDKMADNDELNRSLPEGVNIADFIAATTKAKALGQSLPPVTLEGLITGDDNNDIRADLKKDGVAMFHNRNGEKQYIGVELNADGHVMSVAAAIPRTPSKAQDFLNEVSDFKVYTGVREVDVLLFRRIYFAEGLVNNAISKVGALIANSGSYKVKRVKGQRGKGGDKRAEEFRTLLMWFADNVNASGLNSVITGGRGLKAFVSQGARTALIEGDHFCRTNWSKAAVPTLGGAQYSLPMNIQTFGGDVIYVPPEAIALNVEWIYWRPTRTIINSLSNPHDPTLKPIFDKYVPSDVQAELQKNGRYLMDPALMGHIRHKGQMNLMFGQSFVSAAMSSIAYKRALQALDIVTIENLLNRLLIIKVGSENPESAYHKQEVTAKRVTMLQNLMSRIGPSSTIIWAGPDIAVEDTGANGKIWEMDGRYGIANAAIRSDMGTPAAILTGEGADGKASAIAAIVAVSAQIQELQDEYAQFLKTLAERIAEENGFEDVEVTWEFAPNPLIDRAETTTQLLKGYQLGVVPIRTLIEAGYGLDFEAVETLMSEEVAKGYRKTMWGAPEGVLDTLKNTGGGANPSGDQGGGGGQGRPPDTQNPGKPDPRKNKDNPNPAT
jgi:hypothetical protein